MTVKSTIEPYFGATLNRPYPGGRWCPLLWPNPLAQGKVGGSDSGNAAYVITCRSMTLTWGSWLSLITSNVIHDSLFIGWPGRNNEHFDDDDDLG